MARLLRDACPGHVVVAGMLLGAVLTPCAAQSEVLDRTTAVARALARSPEAAADRAAVGEAGQLVAKAGSYPHNPRLAFEAEGDGPGPWGESRAYRLGVSQELAVGGARSSRRDVAGAQASVLSAEVLGHAHALGRRTEEAFGVLLVERRREALAESLATAGARGTAAARRARERETITPYALRQLELDDARTRESAARARGAREAAEATLRALLLSPANEEIDPLDDLAEAPWHLPADSLAAVALTVRHDVLEARAREQLSGAEVRLAAREGRPGPEIGLFVERARDRVEADAFGPPLTGVSGFDGFTDEATTLGAEVAFPLPLFRPTAWAEGRGQIEEARARGTRQWIEARVPIEVRAACDRLAAAQERAAILQAALEPTAGDGRLLEAAYREGRIDLESYLVQRDRLVAAAAAELDALADVEEAKSELGHATGLTRATLSNALSGGGR